MADDILTQEELNALLAGANGDDDDMTAAAEAILAAAANSSGTGSPRQQSKSTSTGSKSIKVYDFTRPDKFSREHLRTLQLVHETFSRYFATALSAHLRTPVRVEVDSCTQSVYEEFTEWINAPTSLFIFAAPPLEGRMIIHIPMNLSFAMINRLLGGPWRNVFKTRELTEIEQSLIRGIVGKALDGLKMAWTPIVPIVPEVVGYESDPQFATVLAPNDTVCLVSLSLHMGGLVQSMSICISFTALQPIVSKLSAQQWFMEPGQYNSQRSNAKKVELDEATVEVTVELGNAKATMRELLDLEVGDVIRLDTRRNEPLEVRVGKLPKFRGVPGTMGSRCAIKVTDIVSRPKVRR